MSYFIAFLEFANQTARESAEITRLCGINRLVMVIKWQYHYPANKLPPLF